MICLNLQSLWLLPGTRNYLRHQSGVFSQVSLVITDNSRKPPTQCKRRVFIKMYHHSIQNHYDDVIMGGMTSQITSLAIVYSTVYSGADQRKHQSPASLAFVRGIHRGQVNSPHKWPVTRKLLPFDDVIMQSRWCGGTFVIKHFRYMHSDLNMDAMVNTYGYQPNGCTFAMPLVGLVMASAFMFIKSCITFSAIPFRGNIFEFPKMSYIKHQHQRLFKRHKTQNTKQHPIYPVEWSSHGRVVVKSWVNQLQANAYVITFL